MNPLSFDPVTAREVTGDIRSRAVEAQARADADAGSFGPPAIDGDTYQERMVSQMAAIVYREQFTKRKARIERKEAKREPV